VSEHSNRESVEDRLTLLEEAVESLEARVDALGSVGGEVTSKEEKYAAVLEFALEKAEESETVSIGPHDIRECTNVSRRYAYDMIDAMGTSLPGCEVRESDVVETITGTRRRSKALLVDCPVVRSHGGSTILTEQDEPNEEHETGVRTAEELEILNGLTPRGFEEYVADLWRASGYECRLTKRSRDGGVDVVAEKGDKRVLMQVKRYSDNDVGIETVQRVAGLLVDEEFAASRVLVVTTSGFTADAKQRAERVTDLRLIIGSEVIERGRDLGLSLQRMEHEHETELTEEEVRSVVEPGEPVTTVEVADALEARTQSVLVHLESLVKAGEIRVKRLGEENGVWYR
jgi:hypothetical protein